MLLSKKTIIFISTLFLSVHASEISDFYNTQNRCDYLVITPRIFSEGAKELTGYRNQNIEDDVTEAHYVIFENLIDQNSSVQADTLLKNALLWSLKNWQIKPKYVVLFGDDSAVCPSGDSIFVNRGPMPSHIEGKISTYINNEHQIKDTTLTYNDTWYALDSLYQQLFIPGRIPCENPEQLTIYLEKVKVYENRPAGPWINRTVYFSDDDFQDTFPDPVFHEQLIIDAKRQLPDRFSESIFFKDFKRGDTWIQDAKNTFFSAVNNDVNWVIVSAHGHPAFVTDEKVITATDQFLFRNIENPVILFSMSCSNGAYYKRADSSMCKSFLFSEHGGAVAYVASPNISFSSVTQGLMNKLCTTEKTTPQQSIGMLLTQAQQAASIETNYFEVLGDPALNWKHLQSIKSTISFTHPNTIHCTINSHLFEKGTIAWRITKKTNTYSDNFRIIQRETDLFDKEQIIVNRSFDLTIPDNIRGDSLHFSCFIWNDSMSGTAGCTFNTSTDRVFNYKSHSPATTGHITNVKNRGIQFTFNDILSCPAIAEIFNLQGRLLQKITIPAGIKMYLYDVNKKLPANTGITVVRLHYSSSIITLKINNP